MAGSPTTSDEIIKQFEQTLATALSVEGLAEIQKMDSVIMARELAILQQNSICPLEELSKIQTRLAGLNPQNLKRLNQKQFYNADLMAATSCITDSIVYTPPVQEGSVTPSQRIRHWISNLRQIGTESTFGVAMAGSLADAKDMYIFKAPRNVNLDSNDKDNEENSAQNDGNLDHHEGSRELIHELFVGLYGTNKLRSSVPNFAYVYGGFKCSPPIIGKNKEVATWCSVNDYPVNYVIYENITPAMPFYDYARKATVEEYLQQYLQILYALRRARREIGFTHYDLHGDNVLIREITKPEFPLNTPDDFYIRYETENGIEYLCANRVATIIDFGRSVIKYENRYYGTYGAIYYFVYPTLSFPLHDAYKILLTSIQFMKAAGNTETLKEIEKIVSFFNSVETVDEIIEKQRDLAFSFPRNEKTKNLTLDDLTRFIRQTLKPKFIVVKPPTDARVLGCNGSDICFDINETLNAVGLEHFVTPTDLFGFFDLGTRFQAQDNGDIRKFTILKDRFRYEPARDKALDAFIQNQKKLMTIMNFLKEVNIIGLNPNALFSTKTLDEYRQYVVDIALAFDLFEEMKVQKDTIIYAATIYEDEETVRTTQESFDYLINQYYYSLQDKIDKLDNEREVISQSIVKEKAKKVQYTNAKGVKKETNSWDHRVKKNKSLRWFENGLDLFSYLATG